MKGVFVFSHINDIIFINTDESYKNHISNLAAKSGLITKEDVDKPLDSNAVLQLFSPLIASQRFMTGQLLNPYTAIKGEDQFILVFKQFSGFIYLAVNGDGKESEEFLERKLSVLHRIITFLHGPCILEIRPDKQREREIRWKVIGQLLTTWCDLYVTQQSFLVEAVERLHVNDKVNKTSVELLEAALNGMKASGEKQAVHAMLVAQNKLLGFYSTRSATDLSGGDQLMCILLVNKLFKDTKVKSSHSRLSRLSSRETINPVKPVKSPVKIGKNVSRENSNTPLLENAKNISDDSDFNVESETDDDCLLTGFSSDNKDSSENSTDSYSTSNTASAEAKAKLPSRPTENSVKIEYPKLLEESCSSSTTNTHSSSDSHREPLTNIDNEESSLDITSSTRDVKAMTMSLPPLTVVSSPHNAKDGHFSHSMQQEHQTDVNSSNKAAVSDVSNQLSKSLSVFSSPRLHQMSSSAGANNSSINDNADSNGLPRYTAEHNKTKSGSFVNVQGKSSSVQHNNTISSVTNSEIQKLENVFDPDAVFRSSPSINPDDNKVQTEEHNIENIADYHNMTVMLQQSETCYVPHTVHCVLIMEGIYLVIVCELARVTHAKTITQCLDAANDIISSIDSHQVSPGITKHAYEVLEASVKKLGDILKKSKGVPHVERVIVDIGQKWETAKQTDFVKLLENRSIEPLKEGAMNRLEGALSTLLIKLQELFRLLYLTQRYISPDLQQSIINGVETIQQSMRRCLSDYKDYINIMAHRNMPMTIYVDEFPGMVHFIFINRSSNVVVAPSFHESLHQEEDHTNHINKLVKEKVWYMYSWLRQHLASGTTSVTAREDDFHYSYFLWYEDNQGGFPVVPAVPIDDVIKQKTTSMPGVISHPYYTDLQKQCFPGQEKKNLCCFELMCVHISLVPTQLALGHCRKLKDKLWKVSVDTNSPISLL